MDYPVPTAVRIFQRTVFLPALALLGFAGAIAWGDDWPQWRGPQRDGVWREDGILETFPTNGLTVRWRTSIGAGFSGPAVAGGRVFLMDRVTKEDPDTEVKIRYDFRDQTMGLERVLGVDEATGKILWTHSYLCKYSVAYGIGPRATPTVQGDKLYSLGTMGDLYCLEAATGKEVWKKKGFNTVFSTVLLRDRFMYGVSLYGEMCCTEAL